MYLVGLSPASSQAERELNLLKRRLFSETGHPSFLALPPFVLAACSEALPDFPLLDALERPKEGSDSQTQREPEPAHYFQVDTGTGEVTIVPHPRGILTRAWSVLHAVCADPAGHADATGRGWIHRPKPAIHLGMVEAGRIEQAAGLAPDAMSPVRNYRIEVLRVDSKNPRKYWEAIEWETVYERLAGHRRKR